MAAKKVATGGLAPAGKAYGMRGQPERSASPMRAQSANRSMIASVRPAARMAASVPSAVVTLPRASS
jgi:hypothetical protein